MNGLLETHKLHLGHRVNNMNKVALNSTIFHLALLITGKLCTINDFMSHFGQSS